MTIKEHQTAFFEKYGEEAEKFFSQHPRVLRWGATDPDDVILTIRTKSGIRSTRGHITFDEEGKICRFESNNVVLERTASLSEELLAAQITGLLTDNERASRYCEQVSSTLLEDGECVFNAPYGLHMREKEYEDRYHSPKWVNAWVSALKNEFQVKDVTADEKAGIGCFCLRAI